MKVPEIVITRYGVVMIISTYFNAFVFRCLSDRSQKRKIVEVCLALHKHLKVLIKYDAFFFCVIISVLLWHLYTCSNRKSKNEQKESFSERSGPSGLSGLAL